MPFLAQRVTALILPPAHFHTAVFVTAFADMCFSSGPYIGRAVRNKLRQAVVPKMWNF